MPVEEPTPDEVADAVGNTTAVVKFLELEVEKNDVRELKNLQEDSLID